MSWANVTMLNASIPVYDSSDDGEKNKNKDEPLVSEEHFLQNYEKYL